MSNNIDTKLFSRPACLKDFFDNTNINNKTEKIYPHDDITIVKNQQEFGHKKRIKP